MQHHYYTLSNGQTLHYTAWGDCTAPAVVCVHGLTRNARDFDYLAQALSSDFYVLCIDVLGRGESSWGKNAAEYSVLNYAQQIIEWMDGLKIITPHWVGTSMGGVIGLTVQLLSPGHLAHMVLNDVGPVIEPVALHRIAQYIGAAAQFASRAEALIYAKGAFASFGAVNDEQWAGLTDYYYRNNDQGGVTVHYDPVIAAVTKAQVVGMNAEALTASEAALWSSLKSLAMPVMVLRGESSDLLSPHTVTLMQATQAHLSAVTIPNCGHAPHLMDESQTQLIRSFLLQH